MVARRLQGVAREGDCVARLGGDEFAILQADVTAPEQVSAFAQRLLAVIGEPYDLNGHQISIGGSVGIALAPGDAGDADRLLKSADMALYRAKADGRGTFRFFEQDMDARVQARHRLEVDLRAALQSGGLELHYQPLVDLRSGEVTGVRSADPLAASGARHDPAGRVHSGGRGNRTDRAARRLRAAPGLRRRRALAAQCEGRDQSVAAAIPPRQPAGAGDGGAHQIRPVGATA